MSVNDDNKYLIVKPILNKDGCCIAQEVIDSIPSADVAPVRHGRWEADMGGVWCSVCGEYSEGEWDYCPYCGARMDGGNDEID